jgi:hypothetical protein
MAAAGKTALLLGIGALGAAMFVAVFTVLGVAQQGYRPSRQPVSALVLGEHGWVQIVNFVATGLAIGALALGVHRALPHTAAAGWGCALLGVVAVGLMASGVFMMDPPIDNASTVGGPSWHGRLHDVFGLVVFTALSAAAIVLSATLWSVHGLRWLSVMSVLAGVACAALFVAFAATTEAGANTAGVWQRASIIVGWAWLAVLGVTLIAHVRSAS